MTGKTSNDIDLLFFVTTLSDWMTAEEFVLTREDELRRIAGNGVFLVERVSFAHLDSETACEYRRSAAERRVIGNEEQRASVLYPIVHGLNLFIGEG